MAKKTLKFRIYPTKNQTEQLNQWLSLSCELYNAALQERRDAWKINRISINYAVQNKQLTEIKEIRPELKEINSHVLQDALRRLDKAFANYFRRCKSGEKKGYPRFKPYTRFNSFSIPNSRYSITGNRIDISRLGAVKIKVDTPIEGEMKTVSITREAGGKWYACIGVEFEPQQLPELIEEVGVDVGISCFATLSTGEQIENPRFYEIAQKKLAKLQRKLSRRKKGSNRRKKAAIAVAKHHTKIFNQRSHFQHEISRNIVNCFGSIKVEDLSIVKMLQTQELSKQISDASWGSFLDKLAYKAEWAGRKFEKVDAVGTSRSCLCGFKIVPAARTKINNCPNCGLTATRGYVSANLIKNKTSGEALRSGANVIQ